MGVRGAPLDLRAFLLRGHSLRLYRAALRSARRAPAYSREDLERAIREEFEQHRFEGNAQTIRFLLSDGLQRLKQLNTMLGIQGHENDNFRVVTSASKDEPSEKSVPLWRKELTSLEDPAGENLLQNASMEEDIARLQKKRELEKRMESYNREELEKPEGDGMAKSVIEKVLVADFFFILFILAWLVAGLVERSVLESTTLIDSWLPLWTSVFQPALGVFMAGAIVSAVSGYLSKSGNK